MSLPISFLSDFGHADEFVGVVHGVIAKLAPDATVIDVRHSVPRGNIRSAALSLTRAIQYLPEGVALVVVDPGVGTDRAALALETDWGYFVGPDNGVLSPAVALTGGATRIVSIENPEARIPSPGETFHGRDVFAPAAALLSSGEAQLADLGPEMAMDAVQPMLLPLPDSQDGRVVGEAWWIDGFGNVETNIGPDELMMLGIQVGEVVSVRVGATTYEVPWLTAYADVKEGDLLMHVDSAGLLAVAARGGSAAEALSLGEGMTITLEATGSPTAE
jgi:S-adenosylmethionine hydrolase